MRAVVISGEDEGGMAATLRAKSCRMVQKYRLIDFISSSFTSTLIFVFFPVTLYTLILLQLYNLIKARLLFPGMLQAVILKLLLLASVSLLTWSSLPNGSPSWPLLAI